MGLEEVANENERNRTERQPRQRAGRPFPPSNEGSLVQQNDLSLLATSVGCWRGNKAKQTEGQWRPLRKCSDKPSRQTARGDPAPRATSVSSGREEEDPTGQEEGRRPVEETTTTADPRPRRPPRRPGSAGRPSTRASGLSAFRGARRTTATAPAGDGRARPTIR